MFYHTYQNFEIMRRLRGRPDAVANVFGSPAYPSVRGTVAFYQLPGEVLVQANFIGLPDREHLAGKEEGCGDGILGFHIHAGKHCTGNADDPFADAGAHYDNMAPESGGTGGCPHPYHAGDLPPLFVNDGSAFMIVATNRFAVKEILGRTVIVHARADDFRSQPSGDADGRIACGVIQR